MKIVNIEAGTFKEMVAAWHSLKVNWKVTRSLFEKRA